MSEPVAGKCPSCGRPDLFLGEGGYVTCSQFDCPIPDAASELLHLDTRHVVEFDASNFHLEHPAACRLGGRRLMDCPVDDALHDLPGPVGPLYVRRYVRLVEGRLMFDDIEAAA